MTLGTFFFSFFSFSSRRRFVKRGHRCPSLVGTSSPEERTRLPRLLGYCSSVACQPRWPAPSKRRIDAIASMFQVPFSKDASRVFLPPVEVSESGSNKVARADRTRLAAPPPSTTLLSSTSILPRVGLLRMVLFAVLFAGDFRFFPFDRGMTHPLFHSITKICTRSSSDLFLLQDASMSFKACSFSWICS